MKSEKKAWLSIAGGTLLAASGLGTLIYFKIDDLAHTREEMAALSSRIMTARQTIAGTEALEREVIVLREISTTIDQILPDAEDLNNLIHKFYEYAEESNVIATAFKKKPDRGALRGQRSDFDKVSYTLTLKGGFFEFLSFLNKIETHSRFMAVPSFKVTSTTRQQVDRTGQALHKIQVDVETYTYNRVGTLTAVSIEGYERKRDLHQGEINRRRKALTLSTFHYRGDRGRRDPWIDPRVPALQADGGPTVQEQMAMVDTMAELMGEAIEQWAEVEKAKNIIDRMVKKDDLETILAQVDEEIRRVEDDGFISYLPAMRRFEEEVTKPRDELRKEMDDDKQDEGPRRAEMEELIGSMIRHIDLGEYGLALQAFRAIENSFVFVNGDPVRETLALDLRELALEAETLRDFERIEMEFGGSVLIEGRPPVIMINGRSWGIGDIVAPELEIAEIRRDEVDFYFRGFVLTRIY